jgi:hypothetical protein
MLCYVFGVVNGRIKLESGHALMVRETKVPTTFLLSSHQVQ